MEDRCVLEDFCRDKAELWLEQALAEKERADKAEALVRELVGVIDDLCRQINQCGLDEQMWEVYRTAKEVLGNDRTDCDVLTAIGGWK